MKGKIIKYWAGILIGTLSVFTACNSVNVSSQVAPNTNLRQYKTYAWLPETDSVNNSLAKDPVLAADVRNKVNQEMQKKGYRLDSENPDLLLNVRANYDLQSEVQTVAPSYGYFGAGFYGPWYDYYYPYYGGIGYVWGGPMVREVEYTEGTVVIDFIDAKSKKVVWRGAGSDEMYDRDDIAKETDENINEIFEEMPG